MATKPREERNRKPAPRGESIDPVGVQKKFALAEKELNRALVERGDEINVFLIALLCGEHCLFVGPPGCLHPDTPIHDPVDGTTKSVHERFVDAKDFHVTSMSRSGDLLTAKAEAPWRYDEAPMLKITTKRGHTFTVTPAHRIWDGTAFVKISEVRERLQAYGPYPLVSTSDAYRQAPPQDAPHSTQTAEGSPTDCPISLDSCDGQPHQGEGIVRRLPRQQDDAHGHSLSGPQKDGPGAGETHNPCKLSAPRSRRDCSPPSGQRIDSEQLPPPDATRAELSPCSFQAPSQSYRHCEDDDKDAPGDEGCHRPRHAESSSESTPAPQPEPSTPDSYEGTDPQRSGKRRTSLRSGLGSDRTSTNEELLDQKGVSSQPSPTSGKGMFQADHIVVIEPAERQDYYDFHVPIHENYLACGVIHHNTAKTLVCSSIAEWMEVQKFSYLLTKFTDPMELFGPVDVAALKDGRSERLTGGMIQEASFVFLDEIFKSSSAIRNCLLNLLNERTYRYGLQEMKCSLLSAIASSNEYPDPNEDGKESGALFDRFLFRKNVYPVSKRHGRRRLLRAAVSGDDCHARFSEHLSLGELRVAMKTAAGLPWRNDAKTAMVELLDALDKEGINPGDRRIYKSVNAVRAAAYLDQAKEVAPEHLGVLQYVFWEDPATCRKAAEITLKVANPAQAAINDKLIQAEQILEELKRTPGLQQDIEAVKKLEVIQSKFEDMPKSPARDKAVNYIDSVVGSLRRKAMGIKEEEDND